MTSCSPSSKRPDYAEHRVAGRPSFRRQSAPSGIIRGSAQLWPLCRYRHKDKGHPRTHIVIRGKDETGRDLVIAREYLSHGLREPASELVSLDLGLRTDRDIVVRLTKRSQPGALYEPRPEPAASGRRWRCWLLRRASMRGFSMRCAWAGSARSNGSTWPKKTNRVSGNSRPRWNRRCAGWENAVTSSRRCAARWRGRDARAAPPSMRSMILPTKNVPPRLVGRVVARGLLPATSRSRKRSLRADREEPRVHPGAPAERIFGVVELYGDWPKNAREWSFIPVMIDVMTPR
jgi:hypothetical protein